MAVSFETDVKPLFTNRDSGCMAPHGVFLDDYQYMSDPSGDGAYSDHANARHVLARLSGAEVPRMPKGGPFWGKAKLDMFEAWMVDGYLP